MGNAIWTTWMLLAQNAEAVPVPAQDAEAAPAPAGGNPFWISILTLWLPIILLFYWFLIRPQRREQSTRMGMLAALKKNDRVLTVGGVYGVVVNVHREADEVTIKVDETTNTKLCVTLGSITRVLGGKTSEDSPSK